MHERFIRRIEKGIVKLQQACERSGGKDISKTIERRIGRLLEQNSRGAAFFSLSTQYDSVAHRTVFYCGRIPACLKNKRERRRQRK